MSSFLNALKGYWWKPSPKADLHKVEKEEVTNSDALFFGLKFSVLALAIFFLFEFVRMII